MGLQMSTFQYVNDRALRRQDDRGIQEAAYAQDLYRSTLRRARLYRWWTVLAGRPGCLPALDETEAKGTVRATYSVGICTVPIGQIRGSESRSEDFDADFRPLQQRTRARWLSIATASLMGVTMPPVELLQVRDVYYVRDGHHRVSVAQAMGQKYIEAQVMIWELGAEPLCARPAEACVPKPKGLGRKRRAWCTGAGLLQTW